MATRTRQLNRQTWNLSFLLVLVVVSTLVSNTWIILMASEGNGYRNRIASRALSIGVQPVTNHNSK
jgi:hypothetical protein